MTGREEPLPFQVKHDLTSSTPLNWSRKHS